MMPRLLRLTLVLGLAVALGGSTWAECVSAELTPEQKACCESMGHDCGAMGVEMGCCSSESQSGDRLQVAAIKPDVAAPEVLTGPLALLPEPAVRLKAAAARSFDRETLKLPQRPAYLLLSVFLI